ncbi:chaperonin 10-like protein [Suillus subalutaceus]|uniref:chaperonin 10-like protein n=1 Tax=Suillus subalutaceus TaxID=48586 RepID=UPI001B8747B9|nr:chaperonin 10-like protein [Suillus subalutaceus]KAG1838046.1 chaperonin 10-like protein [Suillus subalutaceus]
MISRFINPSVSFESMRIGYCLHRQITMQALKFEKTGSFDELSLVNIDKPILRPGEALVRVRAAGINGSDAAGIIGTLPFVTTPRIPGRDFSGNQEWIGAEVWGTGSDRGFTSDGTFSPVHGRLFRYVAIPIAALSRKPASLDHSRAGSMTLPWLCAWITVDTLANVKEGDNVIIIGARGGIGSAAAQLCKERGARIFGTYTSLAKVTPPSYALKNAIREAIAKAGLQNKIDVLLDCAGYDQPFNDAIFTMTANGTGRVVVMAVHAKDGLFPVNLRSFYTKALTLKGMKSSILGPLEVKEVLDDLAKKIDSGLLEGPKEVNEVDMRNMDNVKGALQEILTRASHVRSVIVP